MSTSVSLTAKILSLLHPLTSQDHLGACPGLHSSVSLHWQFPHWLDLPFFLKGNTQWGSILEIQTSVSPLPSCSGNIKEFWGMFLSKSHAAPYPDDQTWLPALHRMAAVIFCRCSSWQTSKGCHICPLNLRAAETPSRCTSWWVQVPCQLWLLFHICSPSKGKHAGRQRISPACQSLQAQRLWERKAD